MVYLNASQRLGLGAAVTLALSDVVTKRGLTMEPKDLGQLSALVVEQIIEKGEARGR